MLPVRIAIVRHARATDGDHLDLLVGPVAAPDPSARVARCWRLPLGAWGAEGLSEGRFAAREIELHRAEYLSITAPRNLSDGRGLIEPLAAGMAVAIVDSPLIVLWNRRQIELSSEAATISETSR